MLLHKNLLTISILYLISQSIFAEEATEKVQQLATIQLQAHPLTQSSADFGVADQVLDHQKLLQGGVTIGDALAGELGVYSNQFGAGSSRPVIRGQDGARVKVLQNASEVSDVSSLSPDHAVTVDPILAKQVEVIRGPSTLLYAAGTVGGVVNVMDQKIPTQMPEKGYEGQVGLRYNSGSDERMASAGLTAAIGDQFAVRIEGSKRKANDYIAPNYQHEHEGQFERERRVGNTFAEGENLNVGASWIHDRGFVGLAYSLRQDQYGLPGHNHEYEDCHTHGNQLVCEGHAEDTGHAHDHENEAHHDAGPWVDLKSERYDFRTELSQPFKGFEKLRAHASYTDYKHDEIEDGHAATTFNSDGYDARIELVHVPIAGWEGVIGAQYNQQDLDVRGDEALFAPNSTQKYSVFAAEHKQIGAVHVEFAGRIDQQSIEIDSSQQDNHDSVYSGSAALNWEFAPNYKLSLMASHQQRLPLAQELYANGKHFATNTYERGNDQLQREKSNNLELGLHFDNDQLDYHLHVYHNWFDNYIYAATTDSYKDFRLVDYTQNSARFYGLEGQVDYKVNDVYQLGLFGDYVRGKIDGDNAPRVPSGRLGTKAAMNFADGWSGTAEYYHVFKQDKITAFETETAGYNMVNLGLAYAGQWRSGQDYRVYLQANNLLDDEVYSHASFLSNIPQVGRNFTVGLEFGF